MPKTKASILTEEANLVNSLKMSKKKSNVYWILYLVDFFFDPFYLHLDHRIPDVESSEKSHPRLALRLLLEAMDMQ